MKITICIGSSCHLKGSRQIVEEMQRLVAEHQLKNRIELAGKFCMGNCQNGVCVTIDDENFSLKPEDTRAFFDNEVLPRLK
ncbi:MAG TPA: (2Fe-2S) ferredoxin domain-containing protein [Candidatus Limiplasma stercoravium]|nr:(2Fe-2S) ferredoxin domain-containing protein [Candidatus Limiplasma stercoravium]